MTKKNIILVLYALAFIVSVAIAIYLKEYSFVVLFTATFFAIGSGILAGGESISDKEKDRGIAIHLAYVPGLAHYYLREYKRVASFILGISATFLTVLLFIYFPADLTLDFSVMIAAVGILTITSAVDTEYACNKLQLPYVGNPMELKIRNYRMAYVACIFIPSLIPLLTSIYTLATGIPDGGNIYLYLSVIAIFLIISIVSTIRSTKVENNGYSK